MTKQGGVKMLIPVRAVLASHFDVHYTADKMNLCSARTGALLWKFVGEETNSGQDYFVFERVLS